MYSLRKSKKGFTLIELMVVVAIIGVLSLLGLRLYTGQQEKAKNAIVKANASTVHTLIQAELADSDPSTVASMFTLIGVSGHALAGMQNPYSADTNVVNGDDTEVIGEVSVSVTTGTPNVWTIQGYGKAADAKVGNELTAQR